MKNLFSVFILTISIILLSTYSYAAWDISDPGEDSVLWWDDSDTGNELQFRALSDFVLKTDVDDTPVNSATDVPVSSNWAYDHVAAADPHTGYVLESVLNADNTTFDVSTSNHGLAPKLSNDDATWLDGTGAYSAPTASEVGAATTSTKLDDFATPDDNTDLNVSTSHHGLTPKLSNNAATWLDGTGSYSAPSAAEVGALALTGGTVAGDITMDDGTTDSPTLTQINESDEYVQMHLHDNGGWVFNAANAAGIYIYPASGSDFNIVPAGEGDGLYITDVGSDTSVKLSVANGAEVLSLTGGLAISTTLAITGTVTIGTTGTISEETNTMTLDDGDGDAVTLDEIRTAIAAAAGGVGDSSDTEVLFNNSGTVDGIASMTTDGTDLTVADAFQIKDASGDAVVQVNDGQELELKGTLTGIDEVDVASYDKFKIGGYNWLNDTKGNGDTTFLWSADKSYDETNLIKFTTLEEDELDDTSGARLLIVSELKNRVLSNAGLSADLEYDFPARSEGWLFTVIIEAAYQITLDPNGTEQWYLNGTQLAAGEAIINDDDTVGESITCFSTETAVYCESKYENFTEESP